MERRPPTTDGSAGLLARADLTAQRSPRGTSAREGLLVITMAGLMFTLLAVIFQMSRLEWGGLIGAAVALLFSALLPFVAIARRRHERAHPRGYGRRLAVAGVWAVLVAGVGGFLWRSDLVEIAAPAWLTTLVALAAVIPMAALGLSLLRATR